MKRGRRIVVRPTKQGDAQKYRRAVKKAISLVYDAGYELDGVPGAKRAMGLMDKVIQELRRLPK